MSGADIQQVKCVAVGDGAVGMFFRLIPYTYILDTAVI